MYRNNNLPSLLAQLTGVVADNTFGVYGKVGVSPQVFAASLNTLSSHQLNWRQDVPQLVSLCITSTC